MPNIDVPEPKSFILAIEEHKHLCHLLARMGLLANYGLLRLVVLFRKYSKISALCLAKNVRLR